MKLKLNASIIRNGIYHRAGTVIEIDPAEADALKAYGELDAAKAGKPEKPVAEEAPEADEKPKKGKR